MEPSPTGNHGTTKRQEKAAIKKLLRQSRFICPIHDRPAVVDHGQIIGRIHDQIPGPMVRSYPKRQWLAA
jgi:hypothetical protein